MITIRAASLPVIHNWTSNRLDLRPPIRREVVASTEHSSICHGCSFNSQSTECTVRSDKLLVKIFVLSPPQQHLSGHSSVMTGYGAADTDVLITFEDILAGHCGELEASLAQQQLARSSKESEQSADTVGRVLVDDSGYDMRVGMHLQ